MLESGAVDVVYSDTRMVELTAPYVPGYLAFREAEPLVQLINSQRENKPELTPQVREINLNLNLVLFIWLPSSQKRLYWWTATASCTPQGSVWHATSESWRTYPLSG